MTFKTNIDTQPRGFFYALSGDDNWLGGSFETPKRTIQAAIDAAAALSPPPEAASPARVKEGQGDVFFEDIVLKDFVLFEGTQTAIVSTGLVGITCASSISFVCQGVINLTANAVAMLIDGKISFGGFVNSIQGRGVNSTLIKIDNSVDDIFVEARQVLADADGICCFRVDATSPTPIDINCDSVVLNKDNCTFLEWNQPNASDVGTVEVSSVAAVGAGSKSIHLIPTNKGTVTCYGHILGGDILCEGGGLVLDAHVIDGDVTVKSGAIVTIKSVGVLQGDILVEAGGNLFIEASNHLTGTITNNGTMDGIINGIRFGNWQNRRETEVLLSGFSTANQNPVDIDTPLQIEFGAAQGSGSDPVQIDALGNATINEDGQYIFTFDLQYGRTGAGGVSFLYFHLEVNSVQFGRSVLAKLDNANADMPYETSRHFDLVETDVVSAFIHRDSQGMNTGGLFTESASIAITDSPSARITIERSILK